MRPLVIVRPEPGASATAKAARKLGLQPLVMPLFDIVPVEWRAPDASDFDALLLTSANAVRHGGGQLERLRNLPAQCVGEATAEAAIGAGFTIAAVGNGGVDALLDSLPGGLRLLHLCGMDRREPEMARQSIAVLPVYEARAIAPPADIGRLRGSVVAVHSPRAAARVAELVEDSRLQRETIGIVAISGEAAAAAGQGWQRVEAAAEPTDTALLALASRLCNKS